MSLWSAEFPHQGRVVLSGQAFEGKGSFWFALVNEQDELVWSHLGGGGVPDSHLGQQLEKALNRIDTLETTQYSDGLDPRILAELGYRQLPDANLSGVDLSFLILRNAQYKGAELPRANLTGTDFTDANLSRAKLSPVWYFSGGSSAPEDEVPMGLGCRNGIFFFTESAPAGIQRRVRFLEFSPLRLGMVRSVISIPRS